MKLIKIDEIFDVAYGNQLDLNKLSENDPQINFVNRSGKNLGVSKKVDLIDGLEPYDSGLITVALGGSILSTFVQQEKFYTGQNIKVFNTYRFINHFRKAILLLGY